MKRINIGTCDNGPFTLPEDAATQTFAFIARRGAGKTYATGVLVEGMIDAGVQVVILDAVGNWYGLRIAADGKGKGIDIPVLGGLRGDIPLNPATGGLIADIIADSGRSLILDVSQFSKADRQRFATALGVQLWQRKKGEVNPTPVHLVIEESQLIVPENVGKDQTTMVGIYEEIIRLGRNFGIGCTLITQRPQSVNKEVLNQTECLFVLQVVGPHERDALKKWIVQQGMNPKLVDELPGLPIGTAYVWSPQWLNILEKVKIGKKWTYDSTATPKPGQPRTGGKIKPLDLADLKAKMGEAVKQAEANDPKALRNRIADLEAKLRGSSPGVNRQEMERAIEVAFEDGKSEGRQQGRVAERDAIIAQISARSIDDAPPPKPPTTRVPRLIPHERHVTNEPSEGLDAPQQRILDTVLMLERRGIDRNRESVARWMDLHPTGGRYGTNLAFLRAVGYLDGVVLTESGRRMAKPIPTGPDAALAVLPDEAIKQVVRVLMEQTRPLSREDLANKLGLHPTGGRYGTNLARLRTMGLIPERGQIVLTEGFFR